VGVEVWVLRGDGVSRGVRIAAIRAMTACCRDVCQMGRISPVGRWLQLFLFCYSEFRVVSDFKQ